MRKSGRVVTRYRKIVTDIPTKGTASLMKELERYEARSMHGQLPVLWDRAHDFSVFDRYGNRWIDFTSTIFVANTGHANDRIVNALKKKLDEKLLHTYTFPHQSRVDFLKKLIKITPPQFEKAFLLSAGTEATECAIKLARLYGMGIRPSKKVIVSLEGCMHGRTMGAEMLKGKALTSDWIGYKDPNIYHLTIPFPWSVSSADNNIKWSDYFRSDIKKLRKAGLRPKDIAGFIVESYVGWSAYFYPKAYVRELAKFAEKNKSLLIFDDIQGGFGRSGKLFSYQHYGVRPDLVCLGKGISGSLPLSAVIGRRRILDIPETGSMSSTHSANPLSCAAALANITEIEKRNLVKESSRKGKILHSSLQELKKSFPDRISYVFSRGLIAAILFRNPKTGKPDTDFSKRTCIRAMEKGLLLVHTGRESVKIGPPLTIPDDVLKEGLETLRESVSELDKELKR